MPELPAALKPYSELISYICIALSLTPILFAAIAKGLKDASRIFGASASVASSADQLMVLRIMVDILGRIEILIAKVIRVTEEQSGTLDRIKSTQDDIDNKISASRSGIEAQNSLLRSILDSIVIKRT